jgi:glycosyltransferase involved in cell wall biosynthesis
VNVVYSAPNRAHHYGYARELHQAGMLKTFVSGFPRYSPRAPIPEIGTALKRVDQVQTLGFACMKLRLPDLVAAELGHWAKIQLDYGARQPLLGADIFLYYNGCGLNSARWFRQNGGITIVEAVNSHVLVQERLMREEYYRLGLPWHPFHRRETRRRVTEVEEADYVLLPSLFVARSFLAKGIPAQRLLRVPYPMQKIAGASMVMPRPAPDDDVFRVLYVGTISIRKGLRYLVEAFRQLKHPKKELWIVGPTANASGLENLSLPEGVKFFGPLKGDDLQAVYLKATVFCLPSIEEGQALVLSEALTYGLPVIATENTGIEDLLADGKGAMVVPIRDAAAIASCLNRLANDRDFLTIKRQEALASAARLTDPAKNTTTLSATLMQTFHQHHAKDNESN